MTVFDGVLDHLFCFTLVIGGAIFTVPYVFQSSGIIGASLMLLLVCYLNHSVGLMMLDCSKHCSSSGYTELVELVFGQHGRIVHQCFTVGLMFGCQVALLVSV
jgi:amino acid permease